MPNNPPMNNRRKLVGMSAETTSGTAVVPTVALANTEMYEIQCLPDGTFDGGENKRQGNHGGKAKREPGIKVGKLTFKTRLRHGDATFALLELCGCVISGASSEIAKPVWTDMSQRKTGTFRVWEGGRYKQIYGANGTVKFSPEGIGQAIIAEWEFMGVWATPGTQAMPSDPTITTPSYRNAGLVLTVAAASIPQVESWELDLGSSYKMRPDPTKNEGVHRYQVVDGAPMLKLDPEARLVAHYDAFGKYMAGTVEAVQIVLTDGTRTLTIDMPETQRVASNEGTRGENMMVDGFDFEVQKDASGDDVILTLST